LTDADVTLEKMLVLDKTAAQRDDWQLLMPKQNAVDLHPPPSQPSMAFDLVEGR
jgi:hypothetical protein